MTTMDRIPSVLLDSGTFLRGRYRLVAPTQADGKTVPAFDTQRKKLVGLRLIGPAVDAVMRGQVMHNAEKAFAIIHPFVVPILAADAQGDWAFVIRAWVEGETLAARLQRTGPLPPADLQRLAEALASGLLAARRKGLAHHHLTATNVLLADSKNDTGWAGAFITDFGLTAFPATASTGDAADLGFLLAAAAGIGAGERFNVRNARIKLPGSDAFLAVLEQLTAPDARPFADDLAAYEAVDAAIIEWRDPSKRAAASRPAPRPLTPRVPQAPQPEASPQRASTPSPAQATEQPKPAGTQATPDVTLPSSLDTKPAQPPAGAPASTEPITKPEQSAEVPAQAPPKAPPAPSMAETTAPLSLHKAETAPEPATGAAPTTPNAAPQNQAASKPHDPIPPQAADTRRTPASASNPATWELRLSGSPKGAIVHWDGHKAGTLPIIIKQPSKGKHAIRVSAPGYVTQRLQVAVNGPFAMQVFLEEAPAGHTEIVEDPVQPVRGMPRPKQTLARRWQAWLALVAALGVLTLSALFGVVVGQVVGLVAVLAVVGALIAS